jgi:hypothetical protein
MLPVIILEKLMEICPEAKIIVHGRARHPQSQDSVERANQDIKTMLSIWLHDNTTNNWVFGLNFVHLAKNTKYHSGIGNDPCTVMCGQHCMLGIPPFL